MNALAAANLGGLLLQGDNLIEAEKWLRHASEIGYSLPDGGRRARMGLREVERRLREEGDRWADVIPPQPSPPPAADDGRISEDHGQQIVVGSANLSWLRTLPRTDYVRGMSRSAYPGMVWQVERRMFSPCIIPRLESQACSPITTRTSDT